jgi:uncharacterized Tic20 family protein
MAALSHLSAILPMWGIIAPIIIWATQREKSAYVRFQSLQALAYQLSIILLWFAGFGCYFLSFFVMFLGIATFAESFEQSGPPGPFFLLFPGLPFCIIGAVFFFSFLYVVYGLIGAVMTLQGRSFRYAIIGAQIERFLQPGQSAS